MEGWDDGPELPDIDGEAIVAERGEPSTAWLERHSEENAVSCSDCDFKAPDMIKMSAHWNLTGHKSAHIQLERATPEQWISLAERQYLAARGYPTES